MKRICIVGLCVLCFFACLTGCGKQSVPVPTETEEAQATAVTVTKEPEPSPTAEATPEPKPADGYDVLGGTWKVGGIFIDGSFVDLSEYPGVASIYDSVYLIFSKDGTFLYSNLYFVSGTYERLGGRFLLKTERVYRMDYKDGELIEIEYEIGSNSSHIVSVYSKEIEGLRYVEYDAFTGKEKFDSDPIIFIKDSD